MSAFDSVFDAFKSNAETNLVTLRRVELGSYGTATGKPTPVNADSDAYLLQTTLSKHSNAIAEIRENDIYGYLATNKKEVLISDLLIIDSVTYYVKSAIDDSLGNKALYLVLLRK